jgi:hypothetical protein
MRLSLWAQIIAILARSTSFLCRGNGCNNHVAAKGWHHQPAHWRDASGDFGASWADGHKDRPPTAPLQEITAQFSKDGGVGDAQL